MPIDTPLPLEELKTLLLELEAVETNLETDSINDQLQQAEFEEVRTLIQQVREDIKHAQDIFKDQNSQTSLTAIATDLDNIQQATLHLQTNVEATIEQDADFFPQKEQFLEEVQFIENNLNQYQNFLVPISSTASTEPQFKEHLTIRYQEEIDRIAQLKSKINQPVQVISKENHSEVVEENLIEDIHNLNPAQVKEKIQEIRIALQTHEAEIEVYKEENNSNVRKETLLELCQKVRTSINTQLSVLKKPFQEAYQHQLGVLDTLQKQVEQLQQKEDEDATTETLLTTLTTDIDEFVEDLSILEQENTVFEQRDSLLSTVDTFLERAHTIDSNVKPPHPLEVECGAQITRLNNLKTTITTAKEYNQSLVVNSMEQVETILLDASKQLGDLEGLVYEHQSTHTLFEHKTTFTNDLERIDQQLNTIDPDFISSNPPLLQEYNRQAERAVDLRALLEKAKELLPSIIKEKNQAILELEESIKQKITTAIAQEIDDPSIDSDLDIFLTALKEFNTLVGEYTDQQKVFEAAHALYQTANNKYEAALQDLEKFRRALANIAKNAAHLKQEMITLLADHNNDHFALASALSKRLELVETRYQDFLGTIPSVN